MPTLIDRYETIARTTRAMLAAAQEGDWGEVEALEEDCRALIAALQDAERDERLSLAERRRRIQLLRGILADDAEIRRRAEPWLAQLEKLLKRAEDPRGR